MNLRVRKRVIVAAAASLALFSINSSWFAASGDGEPTLIAHRGIHQLYSKDGVGRDTCTATRIFEPTHAFQENTIPSIGASFTAGADIVEIDVHPTVDGEFVVFHDWTVDCRTDGEGVTREQTLAYLKSLDIAYAYTADEGRTFPFRGEGVGMMPTLYEVLEEFPTGRFLINIKSGDWNEADSLIRYLEAHDARDPAKNQIYGGRGVQRIMTSDPEMVFIQRQRAQRCAVKYLLLGWTSYIPKDCRQHAVAVPLNVAWLLWGWPDRFMQRMASVCSRVTPSPSVR
ncbi:MAG: glycerophosphodiester phosphodiesterase family protein, partial [Pseudomonadota bacterium]